MDHACVPFSVKISRILTEKGTQKKGPSWSEAGWADRALAQRRLEGELVEGEALAAGLHLGGQNRASKGSGAWGGCRASFSGVLAQTTHYGTKFLGRDGAITVLVEKGERFLEFRNLLFGQLISHVKIE